MRKLVLLVMMATVVSVTVAAQQGGAPLRVGGGAGYTFLDLETETQLSESDLHDWGRGHGRLFAEAMPLEFGPVRLGVGIAYEYFFWYEYRWSTGSYPTYYEVEVDAGYLGGIAELSLDSGTYFILETNAYFFSDGVGLGVGFSGGRRFRLNERLTLPVGMRTAVVLWDYLVPLELVLAVEYAL